MTAVDIFSQGKITQTVWATFKEIGDAVQGTYIGKSKAINKYSMPQTVYELLAEDGTIIKTGVLDTKKIFHDEMSHVNLGQIIGFKYTKNLPARNGTGNDTKIISIWQDPKIVNADWIAQQKEATRLGAAEKLGATSMPVEGGDEEDSAPSTGGDGWGAFGSFPENQTAEAKVEGVKTEIEKIQELASVKLGVSGDASMIKDKVMEITGLAFLPVNYGQIIAALEAMA
jgi:hypothetical protein